MVPLPLHCAKMTALHIDCADEKRLFDSPNYLVMVAHSKCGDDQCETKLHFMTIIEIFYASLIFIVLNNLLKLNFL